MKPPNRPFPFEDDVLREKLKARVDWPDESHLGFVLNVIRPIIEDELDATADYYEDWIRKLSCSVGGRDERH